MVLSKAKAYQVLHRIDQMFPDAHSELHWDSNFHLFCAVLMSAQTTDKMVNQIMSKFSADFPDARSLAQADLTAIEADIRTLGLFRTKAKHLKAAAQILQQKYHGRIPADKQALLQLPGVGPKVANVVLAEGFGIPAIAVDTHVARIAKAFKIVPPQATPVQVERRLEAILPKKEWIHTHHALIFFGRYRMPARAKDQNPYDYLK